MRIAIFGSSKTVSDIGADITDPDGMRDFCERLGAWLAGFPHAVLVESDEPRTADRLVVSGLLSGQGIRRARVWVYHRTRRSARPPFAAEAREFAEVFLFRPIREQRVSSAHLRILRDADLAVVIGGGSDSYSAALAASLMGVRLIPVAAFGGAGRLLWQQLSDQAAAPAVKLPLYRTWEQLAGEPGRVLEAIRQEVTAFPRIMIVHGRSGDRDELQAVLREAGAGELIVLAERFGPGETVPERFEREALQADAAVVLFTPDDEAAALLDPAGQMVQGSALQRRVRARQNVSLEYGWFWGRLGRDRVLLLLKGALELPSDLAGLFYEPYADSPRECTTSITGFVNRLRGR